MAGKCKFPIHMFLGHKPCGCLVAVECDFGEPTPEVADWLRYGYWVSRIEVNEPVTVPTLCIEHATQKSVANLWAVKPEILDDLLERVENETPEAWDADADGQPKKDS